ncbi:MAG: hypothetical protein IJT54_05135 [Candidatus Methanomethylophilaceae archaeon]|nr:hypothetical protein [Candidatus Methanomethylophilaceae archaeon]
MAFVMKELDKKILAEIRSEVGGKSAKDLKAVMCPEYDQCAVQRSILRLRGWSLVRRYYSEENKTYMWRSM